MRLSLRQIAEHIGGRVIGDEEVLISGLGSLDDARAGQITFLANPKYADKVGTTQATAVILPPGANGYGKNVIETGNPYLAFAKILTLFHVTRPESRGIMDGASVSPKASLGRDITVYPCACIGDGVVVGDRCIIHPGAVIYENVIIGNDVTIHANVSIRERTRIGDRVIIHCGAVIGSDGFGYVPDGMHHYKIPQIGIVVIEDDVEIGANTTIDRAALDVTLVGRGTKLDNLVQVAHNCTIGDDTVIAALSGIAGSTKIGKHVTLGGQVAVSGHISIADNTMIGGRGGVTSTISQPGVFSGTPAIPHRDWLRSSTLFDKLPSMKKSLSSLEKRIDELEKKLESEGSI